MKHLSFFILLFFISLTSVSQNLDSLEMEASRAKDPRKRVELWSILAYSFNKEKQDTSIQLALVNMLQASIELGNDTFIFNSYFLLGSYYENKADFNHSLQNHFKALRLAEKKNIPVGICLANEQAAVVYKQLNEYQQAIYHLKIAEKYFNDSSVTKSLPWLLRAVYANSAQVYLQLNKIDSALLYARKGFTVVDKQNDLFGYTQLLDIFGNVYSKMNEGDSAESYFKKGIALSDSGSEDISLVNTLTDYANFLLGKKRISEAKSIGLKSLSEHEKRFNRFGTLSIAIGDVLAKIYSANKQFDSAYYFSSWRDAQKDSVFNQQKLDAITGLTFSERIRGTEEKMELQRVELRQKQVQMYFMIALVLLFIISTYVFYRSFVNKRKDNLIITKEKKRSDELLLNILPSEVAEELKANGKTTAKDFDSVTVLFTDFKNFTSMSEKLTAQELVNEINYCYSAFDNIISKHGIEKIKTIGDSYMCAGGLPVANKTNAVDTVTTAIEIRDFMLNEKQKREAEGKPFFEIRIGCNTGSVVAGIVGIKKFAYDIWGDTVNIASRMESSGEAGKINISGSTYKLVKEKFNCIHRGKIEAKNKGEIDMYFVEHSN